jgi:hypothetical protein
MWLKLGGKVNYDIEKKLGDAFGWRQNDQWLSYNDLTFDLVSSPDAHLPVPLDPRVWSPDSTWGGGWVGLADVIDCACSALARRAVTCNL